MNNGSLQTPGTCSMLCKEYTCIQGPFGLFDTNRTPNDDIQNFVLKDSLLDITKTDNHIRND